MKLSLPPELQHYVDEQMSPVRGVKIRQSFRIEHRGFDIRRNPERVPIIINNFNRLEYLRRTIDALHARGYENLYVIDNASTYEPLLAYYEEANIRVFHVEQNVGYLALWKTSIHKNFAGNHFVYTDADIELAPECPGDIVAHLTSVLDAVPQAMKAGPGLIIDDLPDHYVLRQQVIDHERQFWQNEIAPNLFAAAIDTTFALYRPDAAGGWWLPSVRTGAPYRARHLPWYATTASPTAEELFYQATTQSSTHWTKFEQAARASEPGPALSEFFDHVYCINLPHRSDRWERIHEQALALGLQVERFEGVQGTRLAGLPQSIPYAQSPQAIPGVVGCALSHTRVLQDAQRKGYHRILVLEDDTEFAPDAAERFRDFISQVPDDWAMLYFGGNHQGGFDAVAPNVARIGGTYAANCYALTAEAIESLLAVMPRTPEAVRMPVDVLYARAHQHLPSYVFRPHLAWQVSGYSDIELADVDYGFLRD